MPLCSPYSLLTPPCLPLVDVLFFVLLRDWASPGSALQPPRWACTTLLKQADVFVVKHIRFIVTHTHSIFPIGNFARYHRPPSPPRPQTKTERYTAAHHPNSTTTTHTQNADTNSNTDPIPNTTATNASSCHQASMIKASSCWCSLRRSVCVWRHAFGSGSGHGGIGWIQIWRKPQLVQSRQARQSMFRHQWRPIERLNRLPSFFNHARQASGVIISKWFVQVIGSFV